MMPVDELGYEYYLHRPSDKVIPGCTSCVHGLLHSKDMPCARCYESGRVYYKSKEEGKDGES